MAVGLFLAILVVIALAIVVNIAVKMRRSDFMSEIKESRKEVAIAEPPSGNYVKDAASALFPRDVAVESLSVVEIPFKPLGYSVEDFVKKIFDTRGMSDVRVINPGIGRRSDKEGGYSLSLRVTMPKNERVFGEKNSEDSSWSYFEMTNTENVIFDRVLINESELRVSPSSSIAKILSVDIPGVSIDRRTHRGCEDVRVFDDVDGNVKFVGSSASYRKSVRHVITGDMNRLKVPFKSPTKSAFEKNWMPVLDKNHRHFRGLYLYSLCSRTFCSEEAEPWTNDTRIVTTLNHADPGELFGMHLMTPVIFLEKAGVYINLFHKKYDWEKFGIAAWAPDGLDGAPGSIIGSSTWLTLKGVKYSKFVFISSICVGEDDNLILSYGVDDVRCGFASVPLDKVSSLIRRDGILEPTPSPYTSKVYKGKLYSL
jgi:hypothetical protein